VWPLCLISTSHAREPCLSRITQNAVCARFEFWYLSPVFNFFYSFSVSMVQRRISEAQRWQIIGMHTTGMSFKAIRRQMGYHYTVVSRLVRKHTQTNNVKDLPRSGRPRITSDRDDRALQRLVRRMPFSTSPVLKQHWLPNRRLSTRTVRNRLKSEELKSRRVIKRPLLADRHRRSRLAWCLARRGWNLRTWRKIHWSDESQFLLHVTDLPKEGLETQNYMPQGTSSQVSLTVEAQ
jgi:transposase